MEAMRIIMDEHRSLEAILSAVRYILGEIGARRLAPDFALMRALVHYLEAYPEQSHHPKEDRYLFAPLKLRTAEGAAALATLEREHAESEGRIRSLKRALCAYAEGAPGGFYGFVDAFEAYRNFYHAHLQLEEREILPLAVRHFTEEDWAAAAAGFRAGADPLEGTRDAAREDEFARIFAKLVAAAPAPVGLGVGPYLED
ncbi:MAG: hemerythrin domain-containing protein [Thauera phenolivorans]|uniref:Hemerythrin domain-containing protein n=1 Tax=Thauera phenolivorans TaxID=1792543 RepID=A0A7X7LV00_9RHOO|nr:hemerythrin domain-containing protein [Thauera phenolivorans]NLF53899.1 hemerythrin domain-containing protein [Thauera phenolivorans]